MADSRFTTLGMAGSGKTCYILGMYYEMCVGKRGFALKTTNETASKLELWMDKLDEEEGQERFPAGTGLTEVSDYSFKLSYHTEPIMSFIWADYGGRALHERENADAFEKIGKSIEESTALYVFIDGDLLCEEDHETKVKNVKRKCARTISPYITEFSQKHGNSLPPIVFVVTKSDLCSPYLQKNKNEINEILTECFSTVFGKGFTVYVAAVSLGKEISDDNYSGEVEPVNIHVPFFIGCYHEFLNFCLYLKQEIDDADANSRRMISDSQSAINKENSRWFFTNYDRIDSCRRKIQEANDNIASNQELLAKYRGLLGAVVTELAKCSNDFTIFQDGREVDFAADDAYSFE